MPDVTLLDEATDMEAEEASDESMDETADETSDEAPLDDEESDADESGRPSRLERLENEGDSAAVSIVGGDLSLLVGANGEVLDALQELTRLAVYRETGERSRLMLDIGGYRADKRATLEKRAEEVVAQVKESGEPASLEPMSPFERKVVHDVVAAAGLVSESQGVEPRRYVVVQPA